MEMNDFYELIVGGDNQLQTLVECNQYTKKFGLSLTEKEALILVKDRKDSLKEQQRVEFGESILNKLIFAFCDSAYLYQENYVDSIGRLQDIFYLFKNETMDELTDDELIDYMRKSFEEECKGSFDYLEDTILDRLAREVRLGIHRFMGGRVKASEDSSYDDYVDEYEGDYE